MKAKRKHTITYRWWFIRRLLVLAAGLFLVIQCLQLLIPAIQYRDEVMNLLYYSDDCHTPCFMGITPGKTTKNEALAIVQTHPDVTRFDAYYQAIYIYWRGYDDWHYQANARLRIIYNPETEIVERISFMDQIPLIAFIGVLGMPDGDRYTNSYAYIEEALEIGMDCKAWYMSALLFPGPAIYFYAPDNLSFQNLPSHQPYLRHDCPDWWF